MSVPFIWVDAFCGEPFSGNPAAVCILERPAPAEAMQSLARELGLSETAYVWPVGDGYSLRWFTPVAEVDLCGHATLAAAYAVAAGADRARGARVCFHTKSGVLTAAVEGQRVEIDLPAEEPMACRAPRALAECWPVVAAATGRFDLVLELPDVAAVRAVRASTPEIARLDYRGVVVAALGSGRDEADYALRFFGPRVGVQEDPVTGSAQCLLGPYFAAKLGRSHLRARQVSSRGGDLDVTVSTARVQVAGRVVAVLEGVLSAAADRLLSGSA